MVTGHQRRTHVRAEGAMPHPPNLKKIIALYTKISLKNIFWPPKNFGTKSAMQFECLILGTSDNQRVSDRHAATWSVHSLGKTAREERESGEKIIEVGNYGVLGNMIIFCFYLFIYFDNQEHGLFWESIRLVNPIKKKKKSW